MIITTSISQFSQQNRSAIFHQKTKVAGMTHRMSTSLHFQAKTKRRDRKRYGAKFSSLSATSAIKREAPPFDALGVVLKQDSLLQQLFMTKFL